VPLNDQAAQRAFSDELVGQLPGLMRYARTLAWDEQRAEDLVSDTVVRALERSSSFDGRSSLATWLHRILHNLAVDQARRRHELPADLDDRAGEQVDVLWADDRYTVDVAVVTERSESREQVQDALLRLPLIYRSAVALHDMEGLTVAEIAEVQEIGLPAAKQRLRRGRMMLVSELAEPTSPPQTPELPLRCWDARSRICDYMDDDLVERDRRLLERHLQACPTCPPLYAGLVGARAALGSRRDTDEAVAPALAARIRERLHL
jgi:RNA polymerase sigma-70 factor, ECF subfamily